MAASSLFIGFNYQASPWPQNLWNYVCVDLHLFVMASYSATNNSLCGATVSRCDESDCHGLLRPNVVFFGETLDSHILTKVEKEMEVCDLCLVVSHPDVYVHTRHILLLCNIMENKYLLRISQALDLIFKGT